jgi:hypothetical protein
MTYKLFNAWQFVMECLDWISRTFGIFNLYFKKNSATSFQNIQKLQKKLNMNLIIAEPMCLLWYLQWPSILHDL